MDLRRGKHCYQSPTGERHWHQVQCNVTVPRPTRRTPAHHTKQSEQKANHDKTWCSLSPSESKGLGYQVRNPKLWLGIRCLLLLFGWCCSRPARARPGRPRLPSKGTSNCSLLAWRDVTQRGNANGGTTSRQEASTKGSQGDNVAAAMHQVEGICITCNM